MTKPSVFVTLALLSGSLMVADPAPAQAAYPGDNGRIVIVGDGGHGTWDVITMDADGTDLVNLTQGAFDAESPVWSPDGTRIAFSTVASSPSGCGVGDVYVMNTDGSDMTPLTTNPFGVAASDPTWSPDGNEIAFTRTHWDSTCSSGDVDIWKMKSDGSGQVLLASGANEFGPAFDAEPAWSPDGDRIAFVSDRANTDWALNHQIYTMDPDGSNVTQVTHQDDRTFESNFSPAWSPDGEQIAYQHWPHRPGSGLGAAQIWRINEDGTGEAAVTSSGIFHMSPAWSPDGRRILFNTHFEDPPGNFNNDIFAINPDGTDQTNVTNTGTAKDHPDWQPIVQPPAQSGKIAFVAPGPSGTFDIWTIDPDGSDLTAVTNLGQDIGYVAWSPDGTKLAFSTATGSPSGCAVGEIYVVSADGSDLAQITATPDVIESDPTWSPDGTRIAYVATTQDVATCSSSNRALRIMNADGSAQSALTAPPDGKFDTEPAWSPTGSTIAFQSNRNGPSGSGKPDIWLVQADGSGLTQLTNSIGTFFHSKSPTWSPDGQQVAFERPNLFFGGSNIWYVGADGTGMTQVTNQSFFTFQPGWSPDGDQIVYLGQDTCCDGLDLWVVDIGTRAMTQLTDGFAVGRPDWQPVVAAPPLAPPTFTGTDPVSPANDNNPRIIGTAAGAVTVTLYDTADCTGPAAVQGAVGDFASPGLPVTVPDNSTTTFHGTATDAAANTSACSTSSITYVEDSTPADLVVTDCGDPALSELTSIEGELIVQDLADCTSLSLPALTDAGGVLITGNSALESVNLASLVTVTGDLTIASNASADVSLVTVEAVSGNLTVVGNGSGELILEAVAVSGNLTVVDNGTATVNLVAGEVGGDLSVVGNGSGDLILEAVAVSGDLTVVDNGTATVSLGGGEVAGNVTLEGQGTGEIDLPTTSGDITIDTSGYDAIGGATAGGTTSIANTDGQAVMRVVLPDGTFETPVAFTITRLEPATLLPEEGTGADGEPATVDPMAAYSFEFAVPVLGLDAALSFDVLLDSLDADEQAALLAALDAGTATLVTKGGEAGDTYQAFPLCAGGAVPTTDGCILVERLAADGQPTTGPASIVRFTGVTGHFSTWGVAVVEPLPPPDPRTQLEDLRHDVETSSIQPGLRLDLANKLEAALKALVKAPPDAVLACEKVAEFARKVELESSKKAPKIPAATAARWLGAAADIRSGLAC